TKQAPATATAAHHRVPLAQPPAYQVRTRSANRSRVNTVDRLPPRGMSRRAGGQAGRTGAPSAWTRARRPARRTRFRTHNAHAIPLTVQDSLALGGQDRRNRKTAGQLSVPAAKTRENPRTSGSCTRLLPYQDSPS